MVEISNKKRRQPEKGVEPNSLSRSVLGRLVFLCAVWLRGLGFRARARA